MAAADLGAADLTAEDLAAEAMPGVDDRLAEAGAGVARFAEGGAASSSAGGVWS